MTAQITPLFPRPDASEALAACALASRILSRLEPYVAGCEARAARLERIEAKIGELAVLIGSGT